MSYVKIDWTEMTAITADRFNHMETQYDEFKTEFDAHDHDSRYYTEDEADARFFNSGNDGPGSLLDADTVDGMTYADITASAIPEVVIGMWAGSVESIPAGFQLCNGSNGTPDLLGRFLVGAGGAYNKGDTSGYASRTPTGTVTVATHALTVDEMPEHRHTFDDITGANGQYREKGVMSAADYAVNIRYAETESEGSGDPHGHPGSTIAFDAYDNRPPYYALCYISKVAS